MAYWATDLYTGTVTAAAITASLAAPEISAPIHAGIGHVRGTIGFASGTNPAANDVIELAPLPPGCVPVDFLFHVDDFGSNELTCKAGIMTGRVGDHTRAATTVGDQFLPASNIIMRTAGGVRFGSLVTSVLTAASTLAFRQIVPDPAPRSIGLAWTAAAVTPTSGSTRYIQFDMWYRQQSTGL
jgi:hypothetical protein